MSSPALKLHTLLEARLAELGMSFRAAAAEMEVSASTLTRLKGGAMPHWDAVVAITTWAGIDILELLPGPAGDEVAAAKRGVRLAAVEALEVAKREARDPELLDEVWADAFGEEFLAAVRAELSAFRVEVRLVFLREDGEDPVGEWSSEATVHASTFLP